MPRFVQQALAGRPITVYGDGKQARCFGHVRDVVEALPKLMALPEAQGEIYNIGSTEDITILDLAKRVNEKTGNKADVVFIPYEKAYVQGFDDMRRRVPDLTKVRKAIGYEPTRSLDDILDDVIAEFKGRPAEEA